MADNVPEFSTAPTYTTAERDRRWGVARAFLEEEELDAMLVYGEHEDAGPGAFNLDAWFTNDRPGQTVLFRRIGDPILIMTAPSYALANLADARRGYPVWFPADNLRFGRTSAGVAKVIREFGLDKARIGVIGLEEYVPWYMEGIIPYGFWKNILDTFPDAEFTPVGLAFSQLMMPLSAEGLAVLRHSAMIGDQMARAMVDAAGPGVSEAKVYSAGMAAAHNRGTAVPQMFIWSGRFTTGLGSPSWAHRPLPPRILEEGDYIRSEVFCCYGGLHTQHQVAIAIGKVSDEAERAAAVARECYLASLEALRPGARFGDVVEAALKPVEAAGGWVAGPQIHGLNPMIGLARIPPGGTAYEAVKNYAPPPYSDTRLGDMELKPGMSFAFEPGCVLGSTRIVVGGTVVVGEDRPIELNPYTAQLLRTG